MEPLQKVFVATAAFMLATVIGDDLFSRILDWQRVDRCCGSMALMVIVFGGLTLWLHDATFIKVKPTIYYTMLASHPVLRPVDRNGRC